MTDFNDQFLSELWAEQKSSRETMRIEYLFDVELKYNSEVKP